MSYLVANLLGSWLKQSALFLPIGVGFLKMMSLRSNMTETPGYLYCANDCLGFLLRSLNFNKVFNFVLLGLAAIACIISI